MSADEHPTENTSCLNRPEWSFFVKIDDLRDSPKTFHIQADERERKDIARRLALSEIESLEADVTLQPVPGMIHAIGTVRASVVQQCVVSLVPVKTEICEDFEGWFGEPQKTLSFQKAKADRDARKFNMEVEIVEESVDPEPLVNGNLDIAELTTQHLSLFINPYPHAPDVDYGKFSGFHKEGEEQTLASPRKSPFEALKDWKEKR